MYVHKIFLALMITKILMKKNMFLAFVNENTCMQWGITISKYHLNTRPKFSLCFTYRLTQNPKTLKFGKVQIKKSCSRLRPCCSPKYLYKKQAFGICQRKPPHAGGYPAI